MLALTAPVLIWGADNASKTLESAAARFRNAKSIKATYTLHAGNNATNGTVTFAGDKFAMSSPNLSTWYDGTTQWTYTPAQQEVSVSEPTAEELQQINPFIIINKFRNFYTAKTLKSTAQLKKIQLTAKQKNADIRTAVVTLNASTLMPVEIAITMPDGRSATIKISNLTIGETLPISTFRFNAKQHPKVQIVDLR